MQKILKNFKNKKVIITGHTGFKGSWLSLWLHMSGAKVLGISNEVLPNPSHFELVKLKRKIISINEDIRNLKKIKKIFKNFQPDFVFHLAAQSLVKKSYTDPITTYQTNSLGTLNVLESLRNLKKKCVAVIITSDKSYKNLEIKRGYNENDTLGGDDPYSASKGAAEFAIQSYIKSYFNKKNNKIFLAVARAGNVIGGGDWSEDRLVPDCIKSWSKNKLAIIRSPNSTRPWQHVLEAISGYLYLAMRLNKNIKLHGEAFNFGPSNLNNYKVIQLLTQFNKIWKNAKWKIIKDKKFKESKLLKLNCNKAKKILNWKSTLSFKETIFYTADWYKNYYACTKKIADVSLRQIMDFSKKHKKK